MSDTAAFGLKADYDLDSVGAIAVGDDSINVRGRLEDGDGVIVADQSHEIAALAAYAPLERVPLPVPEPPRAAAPERTRPEPDRPARESAKEPSKAATSGTDPKEG